MAKFPQSPRIGQAFLSTDQGTQQLYIWSGNQWIAVDIRGGGQIGPTGPVGPTGPAGGGGTGGSGVPGTWNYRP